MTSRKILGAGLVLAVLAGCSAREVILPGERLDIRDGMPTTAAPLVNQATPISLPAARANADWPQRAGSADHAMGHYALSATPALLFAADIGAGDTRRARITADPVVAGGVVYTMDSATQVVATSTAGATLWSRSLAPAADAGSASGGGLAAGGGRVYATTGYGELVALDAATGAVVWTQDLNAVAGAAPTLVGDVIYVIDRDNRGWAIEAANGRVRWTIDGLPSDTSYDAGASVAVSDGYAVFPFSSGQVQATFAIGGVNRWSNVLAGERLGHVAANIGDISGDPVIVGDTVYVGNFSGRIAALTLNNGERKWTAKEGAVSPVTVIGGSVFAVTDTNELARLDAATGDTIWTQPLPDLIEPRFGKPRAAAAHYGPLVAGGRLVVASSDGVLRQFDPVSGALVGQVPLPGGASTNPVIANGVLYVVSTEGQLLAFR